MHGGRTLFGFARGFARRYARVLVIAGFGLALALSLRAALPATASTAGSRVHRDVIIKEAVHQDVSQPLRDIAPIRAWGGRKLLREHELPTPTAGTTTQAVQSSVGTTAAPSGGTSFEGLGTGLAGFTVNSAPPDTDGDVGPNNYVQIVNTGFAVFSKTGALQYGPAQTNTLWSGFGGGCQNNDDGDATVVYDELANRWVISQFSISSTPYLQCVAVSRTGDPTGAYNRYSFNYGSVAFPDYPKLGVWPDAYYTTFNIFNNGVAFAGSKLCAYDRAQMLAGGPATQQCFDTDSTHGGILPSDLDGSTPPPAGSPNYMLEFGTNRLNMWRFHVDWATPANTTLTGPIAIPVASFSAACSGGGTCIPQPGTTNRLDSLADRLMYRLAYRNFGDHESLVVDHSVTAGAAVGIRWYELRNPGGTPQVYQQSTFAPDSTYRWMGSAAMDSSGDIAIGYSASSTVIRPSIRYTGRLATDPLNTLGAEATMTSGVGSQTAGLHRWGDYSDISVDPSDGCTFWYTTEYLGASGSFNWRTRIGTFKFGSCGGGTPPPPPPPPQSGFSITASPSSQTAALGSSTTYSVSTSAIGGSTETVSLSAAGAPAGTTLTFNPTSVTAGGSSTLTAAVGANTAPGSYPLTITGTGTSGTHAVSVTLNVTGLDPVVNGGFETGTFSGWSLSGIVAPIIVSSGAHGGTYTARDGSPSPYRGDSVFTQTVKVPSTGGKLSFWYNPHCPDSLTYDQQQMQIRNTAGTTLATVMNVCQNTGVWTQKTYTFPSSMWGTSVVLRFNVHDDGYPTDPTYMLVDDISIQ